MAGGAGICFVFYKAVGFLWGILPILAIAAFSLALAFYRPNNKPFVSMVEAMFKYLTQSKLYVWKKEKVLVENKNNAGPQAGTAEPQQYQEAKLTGDKLKDLAWSLDVLDFNQHRDIAKPIKENNNI